MICGFIPTAEWIRFFTGSSASQRKRISVINGDSAVKWLQSLYCRTAESPFITDLCLFGAILWVCVYMMIMLVHMIMVVMAVRMIMAVGLTNIGGVGIDDSAALLWGNLQSCF